LPDRRRLDPGLRLAVGVEADPNEVARLDLTVSTRNTLSDVESRLASQKTGFHTPRMVKISQVRKKTVQQNEQRTA
jgi:hypothetical protein